MGKVKVMPFSLSLKPEEQMVDGQETEGLVNIIK